MSTEIQENVSPDKTDQITETKSTSAKATTNKIKDARKVAAGLKLAEKNKIVREALKKQKQREEEEKEKEKKKIQAFGFQILHSQQLYLWLE